MQQVERVTRRARDFNLRLHLDGARLWNACAATGHKPAEYARHFDTVSCCFSKGLGAPAGSAVCGDKAIIARVYRFRKMFGGAMRQAGILAAAALYALDHHRERLVEDHANASRLAEGLAEIPGVSIPMPAETNMVFIDIDPARATGAQVVERLKSRGVLALTTLPQRIRFVCHLDVTAQMIERALEAVGESVAGSVAA
jgi:threonine aldolase